MTRDNIHTCSYSCERPACIKAQRDELVQRLSELTAKKGVTMKVELQSECITAIVRADLMSVRKHLRADLKRRKAGHKLGIFSNDKDEDIAEIQRHIAALDTVIRYYT